MCAHNTIVSKKGMGGNFRHSSCPCGFFFLNSVIVNGVCSQLVLLECCVCVLCVCVACLCCVCSISGSVVQKQFGEVNQNDVVLSRNTHGPESQLCMKSSRTPNQEQKHYPQHNPLSTLGIGNRSYGSTVETHFSSPNKANLL